MTCSQASHSRPRWHAVCQTDAPPPAVQAQARTWRSSGRAPNSALEASSASAMQACRHWTCRASSAIRADRQRRTCRAQNPCKDASRAGIVSVQWRHDVQTASAGRAVYQPRAPAGTCLPAVQAQTTCRNSRRACAHPLCRPPDWQAVLRPGGSLQRWCCEAVRAHRPEVRLRLVRHRRKACSGNGREPCRPRDFRHSCHACVAECQFFSHCISHFSRCVRAYSQCKVPSLWP